jgi:Cu-Zn family superoxide dismutase
MKRSFISTVLIAFLVFSCQNSTKEKESPKTVEVKVERTDSISKATVTTKKTVNGEVSEEIQIFEGSHEEVMEKVARITEANKSSNNEAVVVRNTVKKIQFLLEPKSGSSTAGEVTLTEENGKVTFEATITGLTEGTHAIHLHEKSDCTAEDGTSTGGHWNPTFENHGAWGAEEGFHRGDIGNFIANAEGNGVVEFSTDLWCLDCDNPEKNILGKAVIVHQGEDDLVSQPSGAAGARISCAGIIY